MNPRTLVIITVFVAASVVTVPSPVLGQQRVQQRAQVIKDAPIFLVPDASRTPLRIVEEGTRLTVLSVRKEWFEVEWQDRQYGPRVGYIRAEFVRLYSDQSAPPAATPPTPAPPEPPQVTPPTPPTPEATRPSPPTAARKPVSTAGRRTDLGYVNINGIYQGGSRVFSEALSFDQYAEVEKVTTQYPKMDGPAYDVGVGFRIWRNLGAGVAASRFTRSGTATVDATIPHPLYLRQDRAITGSLSPCRRTETAVHGQVAWVIPGGKRVLITVAGGPSYFSVEQTLVSAVHWSESYPYDTALFTNAEGQKIVKSAVGFNAGVDVGFFFSKTIGVGVLVRYAHAQVPLGSTSGHLNVDAGGFQAGAGLRIRLP
jgi:hypothetical protein